MSFYTFVIVKFILGYKMADKLFYILTSILLVCSVGSVYGQDDSTSFRNFQFSFGHVSESWKKYNDTLSKEFKKKNVAYPPKDIYIRAFKSQNEMELWARNNESSEYKLIKTYRICAISGSLGPKRSQGDRQVPEGYYFIDDFNPNSDYYLSLLLNYPNYSDQIMGKDKLGGDIYIHGGCVTIGCMPMTNDGIQEIYTVCMNARLNGQEYIPVHIFPTRLNKNGMNYLNREFPKDPARQQFWAELKNGYDYFEKTHKLLPVMYTPDGKYVN
jgi:murein L,D-transpeptidase YafK